MDYQAAVVTDGLMFPECPRWHDGRLWFSDMYAGVIMTLHEDGRAEVVTRARGPSGLGWLQDGTLLFLLIRERKLMRLTGGATSMVADLSAMDSVGTNDMVVDAHGRAYIGGEGFNIDAGAPFAPASVILVRPDGAVGIAAGDMRYPNGMVITPDGATLIVAETAGECLTAFDIAADGALSNRRQWAPLPTVPDGICLDASGAVWVACPLTGECLRVLEGGEVSDRVAAAERHDAFACMLGGADGRTLYLCTSKRTPSETTQYRANGWIESARVEVPHAGLP